jgi:hypothetical protein
MPRRRRTHQHDGHEFAVSRSCPRRPYRVRLDPPADVDAMQTGLKNTGVEFIDGGARLRKSHSG